MPSAAEHLNAMRQIRANSGVRAMLIFLNGLTDHRFSALYLFDAERLKSLYFYDRERPAIDTCPEIPVMASYCVFVRNSGSKFSMADSLDDARVAGHPKRLEIRSYCGVPLVDESGRMVGTICHFDARPLPISDQNVSLMEAVAHLLPAERAAALARPA